MRQHPLTYLRANGVLTAGQVSAVRAHWHDSGFPLVHSLIELGFLDEVKAMTLLAKLTGLPLSRFEPGDVDRDLLAPLPTPLLFRVGALPLGVEKDGRARVATCGPFDILSLDDLRMHLRRPLELTLAPWSLIRSTLENHQTQGERLAQNIVGEMLSSGVNTGTIIPDAADEPLSEAVDATAGELSPEAEVGDVRSEASASVPIVRLADLILADAFSQRASDIHLEPLAGEVRLRFRTQGVLKTVRSLPRIVGPSLVSRFKILSRLDITARRKPQDGKLWFRTDTDGHVVDVRVSTLPTVTGEKVVMRLLDARAADKPLSTVLDAADLPVYLGIVERPQGLVLVTGPTGSGKSTTLYATLRHLLTPELNFVTIEQPVEYHLDGVAQVHVRPEEGSTFAGTLRSILRQDPDVILVGEIRDSETASVALQAATTGHLVLSTLHTNDAASACSRYVDLGGAPFLLSDALNGVLAQRLIRELCPSCKKPAPATDADVAIAGNAARGATLWSPVGCSVCEGTGYKGRVAVFEVATATRAIRDLILEGRGDGPIRESLRHSGVPSMFAKGIRLALTGRTSLKEVTSGIPMDEVEKALACRECGAIAAPGARFCVGCGRPARDRCSSCGASLEARWKHCGACGVAPAAR